MNIKELLELLRDSLPLLTAPQAEAVISVIRRDVDEEEEVMVGKRTIVPPNSRCRVKCRSNFETAQGRENVAFTPYPADTELEISESVVQVMLGRKTVHVVVSNPTNQPITVEKGMVLGTIEAVSAVIPIGPSEKFKETKEETGDGETQLSDSSLNINSVQLEQREGEDSGKEDEMPKVDLSHKCKVLGGRLL